MTDDPRFDRCWRNPQLVALRHAYPQRSDSDRPDWLTEAIDADGTVRVLPLTLRDLGDWDEGLW